MSVINQMLIDLDRRRASSGERASLPDEVRPLPVAPRSHASALALRVALPVALLGTAWAGYQQLEPLVRAAWRGPEPAAAGPLAPADPGAAGVDEAEPAGARPPVPRRSLDLASQPSPAADRTEAAERRIAPSARDRATSETPRGAAPRAGAPAERALRTETAETRSGEGLAAGAVLRSPAAGSASPAPGAPSAPSVSPMGAAQAAAPPASPASLVFAPPAAAALPRPAPAAVEPAPPPRIERHDREPTPAQRSDQALRRAVEAIASGRHGEAEALLRESIGQHAANEPARQALFGLLVDLRRLADAEQVLRDGLRINPQQTGFAMALARLQVERGDLGGAIDTLARTLPAARDRADYLALLAAVQQRAGRHEDAIASYQAALRLVPQNGVWWMGLGLALEGDGRLPEAAEALRRARESGSLNAELTAFVDQRLRRMPAGR